VGAAGALVSAPGRPILIAATVAAPLFAATLTLADPPLSYLSLAVPIVYLALLVTGVMSPRLGMFGQALCQGPSSRPEVALTFDDGPDPATTPKILAALAQADVRATFFVLGGKARQAPEVLRDIAAAGHDIGIHGDTHDRLLSLRHPATIVTSLERALAAVESVLGQRPTLFRPPIGHVSPRTAAAARQLGLTLVAWSVRSRDLAPSSSCTTRPNTGTTRPPPSSPCRTFSTRQSAVA
jgi:peptidoglycan/xylan/chitin deacetylase (PgdA/CDA1 family)